jgi:23S rRNA (uracil1939-C5)-methyltransferase
MQMSEVPESVILPDPAENLWRQGELVEITITDLSDSGDGVGRFGQRVVFVPDTVTGDRILARLIRVKPQYAWGKLHQLLHPSSHRIRPHCIVADKCGGCQWQHVSYAYQLEAKRNQVIQALERIGGFSHPPVDPVLHLAEPLGYRNKATYPVKQAEGRSQKAEGKKQKAEGSVLRSPLPVRRSSASPSPRPSASVQAGYYQKGSHQIVNLNQCPIQDQRLNPLLAKIKLDLQRRGWRIYDEVRHQGTVRHLGLRIGRRTGEMLLTLVVKNWDLPGIEQQAQAWLGRYPELVGVLLNRNPDRTNTIFGSETRCIAGQPYLQEEFAGLTYQIRPDTFFQVHTEQAEALLHVVLEHLKLQGSEVVLDAYCGIGTLTLPLAQRVQQAIGLEVEPEAVAQARLNAELNAIANVSFQVGAVEECLSELQVNPDIVLLDPPRKGCEPVVIETLRQMQPQRIVYISCNPATLARDLKQLCADGSYNLTRVQPADFFPQTSHIESAAFLERTIHPQNSLL